MPTELELVGPWNGEEPIDDWMKRRENAAPDLAGSLGHAPEWDPPAAMTAARRWTCWRPECGRAVLDYKGNIYGEAIEGRCPAALCACGCGARASIATRTNRRRGTVKGQTNRYLPGHGRRGYRKPLHKEEADSGN